MSNSLTRKIIKGGGWLTLNQLINQPVRIIVSILLIRMLLPDDFGLVAKTFAITGIAELVFVQGVMGAIIQDQNIKQNQISTLFWITFFWSALLATLVFFAAGFFADFYEDDRVFWITHVMSITIISSGLSIIPATLIKKELKFHKIFIASVSSVLISSFVGLYMAWNGFHYKALVFQFVLNNLINTFLLLALVQWRPNLKINISDSIDHIKFGLNMMGTNFLNYLVRNADNVAIGKFQNDITLGAYSRAYFLVFTPLNIVNQIFQNMLFSVFSKLQDDKKKTTLFLITTQEIIVVISFPIIILFYYNTNLIILKLLGIQWLNIIILLKIFLPLLLIQLYTSPISTVFLAFNKTRFLLKYSLITKPILLIAIAITSIYGSIYVAISILILSGLFSLILFFKGLKILKISYFTEIFPKQQKIYCLLVLLIVSQAIFLSLCHQEKQNLILSLITIIFFYVVYIIINKSFLEDLLNKIRNR